MIGNFTRFDMSRRPNRQWRILTLVTWLACIPKVLMHRTRIDKTGMPKGLKPPYFLLCNHNAFMDFLIMTRAIMPWRANYVVAIDAYIGLEFLLRGVGGIAIRKFTRSINLVKNMLHARNSGSIVALFPEARYSLCGTSAVLPASLGKMVRKMNVPVVTLIMHGHHINCPFWHKGNRWVAPIESEMKQLFSKEETQTLSVDEINARIEEAFRYDDFAWQKEKGIRVKAKDRAEGLHKVLYQCPVCHTEYKMSSSGSTLRCDYCGKAWEMDELGSLSAQQGETEFSHIPDWYEWERSNVRREVREGAYSLQAEVRIESLPNAKGLVPFEKAGQLTHNGEGFTLSGEYENEAFTVHWPVPAMYSCHIEYNFKNRGDSLDLSNNEDTFFVFPQGDQFALTKIALATEELYYLHEEKISG